MIRWYEEKLYEKFLGSRLSHYIYSEEWWLEQVIFNVLNEVQNYCIKYIKQFISLKYRKYITCKCANSGKRWMDQAMFQFSSVTQSCLTLYVLMDCSTPGLPVHHQLLELTQTHAHRVSDAIQPSHPLSSPSAPAFNLSQHHGLFEWVSSSHQVAKVLEFQPQHQSFQLIVRTGFL